MYVLSLYWKKNTALDYYQMKMGVVAKKELFRVSQNMQKFSVSTDAASLAEYLQRFLFFFYRLSAPIVFTL